MLRRQTSHCCGCQLCLLRSLWFLKQLDHFRKSDPKPTSEPRSGRRKKGKKGKDKRRREDGDMRAKLAMRWKRKARKGREKRGRREMQEEQKSGRGKTTAGEDKTSEERLPSSVGVNSFMPCIIILLLSLLCRSTVFLGGGPAGSSWPAAHTYHTHTSAALRHW